MKKLSLVFFLLVAGAASLLAQRTVIGKVTDAKGEGLIGASILAKGTTRGTVTDIDGAFSLSVPENTTVLVVSYTGFKSQNVALGASNTLEVTMETDAVGLDETVVIGYGTQSNRNRISSISTVNPESIHNNPLLGPQQLLQGTASGVQMTNTSGVLGSAAAIRIRGVSSINAGGNPLFVVDGVPLNDGSSGNLSNAAGGTALNPLADINPNDIESMTVLKDASSSAIYGSRAANGVIVVTTKRGKGGQPVLNFDVRYGIQAKTNRPDLMNSREAGENLWQKFKNMGLKPGDAGWGNTQFGFGATPVVPDYIFPAGKMAGQVDESTYSYPTPYNGITRTNKGEIDWYEKVFVKAPVQEYNLAVSGGVAGKSNYSISAG